MIRMSKRTARSPLITYIHLLPRYVLHHWSGSLRWKGHYFAWPRSRQKMFKNLSGGLYQHTNGTEREVGEFFFGHALQGAGLMMSIGRAIWKRYYSRRQRYGWDWEWCNPKRCRYTGCCSSRGGRSVWVSIRSQSTGRNADANRHAVPQLIRISFFVLVLSPSRLVWYTTHR